MAGSLCWLSNVASAQVVALGASNTAGQGVSSEQAYPAQLQAMLRVRGINVSVINAGINGDTTSDMLARLDSAVPAGTRVVILQPGRNDARRGLPSRAGEIQARLRARGVKVIILDKSLVGSIPAQYHQPDQIHLTAEGYHVLAARLLPRVASALRSSR